MDPASIIGIVGSVVGIADVVTRSIKSLNSLKTRYRDAPALVSTLIGQLYKTQAALEQLSLWAGDYSGIPTSVEAERYAQLAAQVGNALDCFDPLISSLQQHLNQLECFDASQFSFQKRISFLWNERDLNDYLTLLDRQVNALTLLLEAIQCKTFIQQRKLLAVEDNQTVLHLARDCSSSVAGLNDITEYDNTSIDSESTTALSTAFDFDASLMSSKAYQTAQRSYLRQLINSRRQRKQPGEAAVNTIEVLEEAKLKESKTTNDANPEDLTLQTSPSNAPRNDGNVNSGPPAAGVIKSLHLQNSRLNAASRSQKTWSNGTSSRANRRNGIAAIQSNIFRKLKIERNTEIRVEYDTEPLIEREPDRKHKRRSKQTPKVLLLGTSESGKSTLLKAMIMAQENFRYEKEDMHLFRETIFSNIQQGMLDMLRAMEDLKIPFDGNLKYRVATVHRHTVSSKEVRDAIEALRADPGLREAYDRRREYQLQDNLMDYLDDIQRIADDGYLPTTEDILRSRVRTTGIHKYDIRLKAAPYRVFDVGGERSERKKWIHCFPDVDVVVFTIDAIAENKLPDELVSDDEHCNRMQEQLNLFKSIANSTWFKTTSFIIVFTKLDRLEDFLKNCKVQEYLPDYPMTANEITPWIAYSKYLERRFLDLVPEEKRAYTKVLWSNLTDPGHSTSEEVLRFIGERSSMSIPAYPLQSSKPQGGVAQSTRELAVIEETVEEAK